MSDPDLERRALALLGEALDQPDAARDAWVIARTADRPALRDRVLHLIARARTSASLATGGAPADAAEPDPPARIGAYRIAALLGQGGMGAVYRAERDAGDFAHVVAIKLIRPGALSDALVERFGRERQTLASLAHPNIARLFDGGTTLAGEPFIVMEYVDGLPITRWADEHALDMRARIALFLAACDAVRFAHQNLVVHRDITPSNVLVTADGRVKLIDFGIAKPPQAESEAQPGERSLGGLSLTPGYAAPERSTGGGTTTLADVYSLGRLLDALREGRGADADLAAIVARACAPEAETRYASVDALIDDIERWRDGRVVAARGGGRRYSIGKWIGRHRAGVAIGGLALALILAALAIAIVSYANARRAYAAEAQRFGEVRSLAGYLLFRLSDTLAHVPGNTAARASLAAEAQRYLTTLARTPGADPQVRLETARGLIKLAKIQGVPPEPNLGDKEIAAINLETAGRLLAALSAAGVPASEIAPDRVRQGAYLALIRALFQMDGKRAHAALDAARAALASANSARTADWYLARATLRRAEAEVHYIEGDDPAIARTADVMDRELAEWPRALRATRAGDAEAAYAAFYRASGLTALDSGDRGVGAMLRARRALAALDRRWPNDPATLYTLVYNDYMLFAAAARAGQQALSSASIAAARDRLARLMAIEENDNSLDSLGMNLDEAYAQDLSNRGLHAQALAEGTAQLARLTPSPGRERKPATLARLAFLELTLGRIGRESGDRAIACEHWTRAGALFDEARAKGRLAGFLQGYEKNLRGNIALCAAGRPISAFLKMQG